jgi:hypothetical protein
MVPTALSISCHSSNAASFLPRFRDRRPTYFVREMNILRGGMGLTWPNEVDFSADGLRHDAFPDEQIGEYDASPPTNVRHSPPQPA